MELDGITVDIPANDTEQGAAPEVEVSTETEEAPAPEVVDWQKKASTLQEIANRKDKQLNKLRAEMAELARIKQLYELEKTAPQAPKEESFNDVADLIAAKLEYSQRQKQHEEQLKQLQATQGQAPQAEVMAPEVQQALQQTSDKIAKAVQENPVFRQTLQANIALVEQAPPHIEQLFSHLENPEAALFDVLKSGELEALYYMNPTQAAIKIAQAEQRGKAVMMQRPVTKAQPPIAPNKGTSASRGIESLRGAEALKWLNS